MFCIITEIAGFVLHFDPQLSNSVYADLDDKKSFATPSTLSRTYQTPIFHLP